MICYSQARIDGFRLLLISVVCFILLQSGSAQLCTSCTVGCCDAYMACPVSRSSCVYYTGTATNTQNDNSATCTASTCANSCCATTTTCGTASQCVTTCNATNCEYGCCVDNACGSITACGVAGQIIAIVVLSTALIVMVLLFLVLAFSPFAKLRPVGMPAKSMAHVQLAAMNHGELPVYHSEVSYQNTKVYDDRRDQGYGRGRGASDYSNGGDYRVETYQPHDDY